MDGRANLFALLFAGAHRVNSVAHHLQCLKRNHDLVILNEVAGKKQEVCGFHFIALLIKF
jgi:hypothetical protein